MTPIDWYKMIKKQTKNIFQDTSNLIKLVAVMQNVSGADMQNIINDSMFNFNSENENNLNHNKIYDIFHHTYKSKLSQKDKHKILYKAK